MPVHVHIPIRLRLDLAALEDAERRIGPALEAALLRAMVRSREVVLEPRGTFVRPRFHAPHVAWSGTGAPAVAPGSRRHVESVLRELVIHVARSAGVTGWGMDAARPAAPIPPYPAARFDLARWRPNELSYRIESYGEPDEEPVPMGPARGRPTKWGDKDYEFLATAAIFQYDVKPPRRLAFLSKHGKEWKFTFAHFKSFSEEGDPVIELSGIEARAISADALPPGWTEADLPFDGEYRMTLLLGFGGWVKFVDQKKLEDLLAAQYIETLLEERMKKTGKERAVVEAELRAEAAADAAAIRGNDQDVCMLTTPAGQSARYFPGVRLNGFDSELSGTDGLMVLPVAEIDWSTPVHVPPKPPVPPKPMTPPPLPPPRVDEPAEQSEPAEGEDVYGRGEAKSGEGLGQQPKTRHRPTYPRGEGDPEQIPCEPFNGEPYLTAIVDQEDRDSLKEQINQIAYRLQIDECYYPGTFCIKAAKVLGSRAGAVGKFSRDMVGEMRNSAGDGNLGSVDFTLPTTGGMNMLKYLARTAPYISALRNNILSVIEKPENAAKIEDERKNNAAGWQLDFLVELNDAMKLSVGWLFIYGCQLAMLALLNTSAKEIQKRLDKFHSGYGAFFEQLVRVLLFDVADLERLAEQLNTAAADRLDSGGAIAREIFAKWKRGHRLVGDTDVLADEAIAGQLTDGERLDGAWQELDEALSATLGEEAEEEEAPSPDAGKIVERGGELAIVDKHGKAWTAGELQHAIGIAKGTAESIDPLVKQIFDLPGMVDRFRADPSRIRAHALALLLEMKTKNAEITGKTIEDDKFAFTCGPLGGDDFQTSSYFSHSLVGIHKLVYDELAPEFAGDGYLYLGIDSLFSSRKGFEMFFEFFTFLGSVFLAVACPPLAMAFDAIIAQIELDDAQELKDVHRALIDPEIVVSQFEVQLGLFFAELGYALAVIPAAGKVLKKGLGAGKGLLKHGVKSGLKSGVKTAGKELVDDVVKAAMKELKGDLAAAFAKELAQELVMDQVMQMVIEPFVEALNEDLDRLPAPEEEDAGSEDWPVYEDDQ